MSALYVMPGNDVFADLLAGSIGMPCRELGLHRFPDGESLVRVRPPLPLEAVAIVCTLDRPDPKLIPLLMAAATLRELGAPRIGLVAPYLAYMRQDTRFHPGEAVSARIIGQLLGRAFDWLVTVDPHLHRFHSLGQAYPLDGRVVHAAARLVDWIREHVERPLIIGPDGESAQWANDVARQLDAPCVVASKVRHGDRDVQVHLPGIEPWSDRTPVLLDDIISSGATMAESLRGVRSSCARVPVCVGVHGIFAEGAVDQLRAAGAGAIVSSNTIPGEYAAIDVSEDMAAIVVELMSVPSRPPVDRCQGEQA